MFEPNNTLIIKPEIVAPPDISNVSVAQVETGMFSTTMQDIMIICSTPAAQGIEFERKYARPLLIERATK